MTAITTKHCLPENIESGVSFYERLKRFVFQYEKIIEEQAQADGRYLETEARRKTAIVESYVYSPGHCEPLTRNQIAKIIGTSAQTVSNKLDDFCSSCRQILLNGETVDGITADVQLVEDIKELADNFGSTVTLETFKFKTGILDNRTLLFFCNLLGMKQTDSKQYERVVSKNRVNDISEKYDTLLTFFRQNVINIRYQNDFLPFLKATFADTELQDSYNSMVCHSQEFIWDTRDGVDYVALRWDKLRDRAPRVCWILYELGADSIKNAVLADEVRKVYSRYAKRFGIDDELPSATLLNILQREKCWKPYPLGKTEFWMNRESEKFEYNLHEYARQYVQNHPNDLVGYEKQAKVDGYARLYKSFGSIIDAFYSAGGSVAQRRTKNMGAGRIHYSNAEKAKILSSVKNILEEEAMPMFQSDLKDEVLAIYPNLNEKTLSSWIKNNKDIFIYTAQKGRNSAIISLIGMKNGHQPRTYRQKIKDEAVKYLFEKVDYKDDKKTVYDYFRKNIPEGINADSALSAIFSDSDLFSRTDSTIRLTDFVINEEQAKISPISDMLEPVKVEINKLYTPEYDWESLKLLLYKELHAEFRIDPSFNLDKNLETMFEIMAYGDKKISKNSIFHGLLSSLPDFFKKELAEDRKMALRDNCDKCLEPYFKSFYALKYGRELISDIIYDFHLTNNSAGLGTICKYFEENLCLLPYQNFVPNYSLEFYIKKCLNESKSKRNIEIGHPDYYVDLSDHSVMNRICEVFSVFVYLASKY